MNGRLGIRVTCNRGLPCRETYPSPGKTYVGISRFEFDGFLKDGGIEDHAYGIFDLEEDLKTIGANT